VTPEILNRLSAAQAAGEPVALLTRLSDGEQHLTLDGEAWFVHPHNPPLRLLVVGAVHVAQALVPMALPLGFAVTVIDPRRAFATEERFGGRVTLCDLWPDEAMAALKPDGRTAVVTLTHDPKLDDPALDVALRSRAFYIGALGSRRTQAKRVARLQELGHGEAAIARIHAPVGLDIGAVTAPEIALSVLAQVVMARRGTKAERKAAPPATEAAAA
jgi:xanthine dehydrogenase accessory factor